jgi:hypothetical protein
MQAQSQSTQKQSADQKDLQSDYRTVLMAFCGGT